MAAVWSYTYCLLLATYSLLTSLPEGRPPVAVGCVEHRAAFEQPGGQRRVPVRRRRRQRGLLQIRQPLSVLVHVTVRPEDVTPQRLDGGLIGARVRVKAMLKARFRVGLMLGLRLGLRLGMLGLRLGIRLGMRPGRPRHKRRGAAAPAEARSTRPVPRAAREIARPPG